MPSRRPPAPLLSSGGLAPRHTEAGRTRRPTPLILLLFACRSVAVETEACVIQTDRLTRTRTEGRIVELLEVRHGVHRGLGLFGRLHLDVAVARKTGTGRDELSEDDVLLEAEQRVGLGMDRRIRQNSGGLLEGRRRQPGLGCQRSLGDTHQLGPTGGRLVALGLHTTVLGLEATALGKLAGQQVGIAGLDDRDATEHLTDDDLDVLVVDRDTLLAVDALDLVHQVHLHLTWAEDPQHLLRVDRALDQLVAHLDVIAIGDEQTRALAHRVGVLLGTIVRGEHDPARLVSVLDHDAAVGLGDRSHALGGARLEELDHTRQTLRDVIACHTTGVEGAHRQLGAGLADGLGGDDADRLADVDHLAGGQGSAVARGAGTDLGVAGQDRTDPDLLDPGRHERADDDVTKVDAGFGQQRSVVLDVLGKRPRVDAGLDVFMSDQGTLAVLLDDRHEQPTVGAAVFLTNDDVLRDIHQTTGQVTRVGGTQRGVGQTLSGAVRRDEELQDGQTLTEVRLDRARDDLALGVGHQATHAGDLTQLHPVTARPGGHHPVDGVAVREIGFHLLGDLVGRLRPDLDELLTTLVVGDQPTLVLGLNLGGLGLVALKDLDLARRRDDVGDGDRRTRTGGPRGAGLLQRVQRGRNLSLGVALGQVVDDQRQALLVDLFVDEGVVQGQRLVEERPAQGGLDGELGDDAVLVGLNTLGQGHAGWRDDVLHPDLDRRAQLELVGVERHPGLRHGGERTTGAFAVLDGDRQEVDADDHVLGGHGHRTAIGRLEDVVARQHQDAGFGLGLCRQRQVHSHLVTVEVGVEGRTDQRVDLDGLALDELRLEGLDAEAVQRRRTVEQNRVFGDDLFEDVPHVAIAFVVSASPLDHALGALDVLSVVEVDQPLHHERLEELQGHLLGQTTLVQLQLRTDDDDRTAGVVDALAEEVLAEATLLALEHVGERFQRTVAGARDRATTTAVVEERVHSLLQHALLVVDNDLGRAEVEQSLEPVVAVDHATVKVVQVGGGEPATIELDHRPQVRRNDRNAVQDHAGRVVAGHLESSDDAQTLERAGLLLALAGRDDLAQHLGLGVEVEGVETLLQRRGAHRALEVQSEAVTHLAVKDLVALEVLDLEVLEPVPDLL